MSEEVYSKSATNVWVAGAKEEEDLVTVQLTHTTAESAENKQ